MIEFIEAIPYKETRDYVMSILRNHYWYRYRRGLPAKSVFDAWVVAPSPTTGATPTDGTKDEPNASPSVTVTPSATPGSTPGLTVPPEMPGASVSPTATATPEAKL